MKLKPIAGLYFIKEANNISILWLRKEYLHDRARWTSTGLRTVKKKDWWNFQSSLLSSRSHVSLSTFNLTVSRGDWNKSLEETSNKSDSCYIGLMLPQNSQTHDYTQTDLFLILHDSHTFLLEIKSKEHAQNFPRENRFNCQKNIL